MPRRNSPEHPRPGRGLSSRARAARALRSREDEEQATADRPRFGDSRRRRPDEKPPQVVICPKGKRGFSETVAREKLAEHSRSNRPNRPVRVYLCPYCDAWHLTSRATPPRFFSDEPSS